MQCILISGYPEYLNIILPNKKEVIVGRGPETRIKNTRCSKNQVRFEADYDKRIVKLTQLGPNPSHVHGSSVKPNQTVNLSDGITIYLLKDEIPYTIKFESQNPLLNNSLKPKTVPKRRYVESFSKDNEDTEDNPEQPSKEKVPDIHPFFKIGSSPQSQAPSEDWEVLDSQKLIVYKKTGIPSSSKIAAFDLDHTVITTKSGKVFPENLHDWRINYAVVPIKLKELYEDGYKIVLFTNQRRISKGRLQIPDFESKIEAILAKLPVPIQVFASTGIGVYRKPAPGMWEYLKRHANGGVPVNSSKSFYVGDAAGRPEGWEKGKKKDFASSDRLFSINIGIKFYTPEEFFLDQSKAPFKLPDFDPRKDLGLPLGERIFPSTKYLDDQTIVTSQSEIIVFAGFPAAGKTFFVRKYLIPQGYEHVNRDTLGTWQKCSARCQSVLAKGGKVVIDNTNPDEESRKRYINIANKFKVPCRCFWFDILVDQARHQNTFRELVPDSSDHPPVSDIVLNTFKSKFQPPTTYEGFSEIIKINFKPAFRSSDDERLYKMFLLDK